MFDIKRFFLRYCHHVNTKKLMLFICTLLYYIPTALAIDFKSYSREEWEKIVIIIGIVITIACPTKYRIIILGTALGLTFSYYTYKYLVPFILQ